MKDKAPRLVALVSNFMVFTSATIVTGILGWFLHITSAPNTHVIYQVTVAAASVPLYLGYLVFPQFRDYPAQTTLANLIFSYLWLTSSIFAAEDWTDGRCGSAFPPGGKCGLKKTVVAFDFLAFFFILVDVLVRGTEFYIRNNKKELGKTEHEPGLLNRPLNGSNLTSTAP